MGSDGTILPIRSNFHFPGPAADSLPLLIFRSSLHPLCLIEMFVLDVLEMGEGEKRGLLSWDCVVGLCQGFFESGAKLYHLLSSVYILLQRRL